MSETVERILEKCPDRQRTAVAHWLESQLSKVDSHDGLPVFVISGEMLYEKTGNTRDGRGVYCHYGDFVRACRSFSDVGLFVHCDGRMVPRAEYAA